jgi:uncharacterized protein (TIGR02284 family)
MDDAVRILNDLIATCRDSEEGFGKAAKGAHSENLRNRLTGIALERGEFADELADHVRKLGGQPAESGHQSGIQHRGWRELEERIRPKSDAEFLVECESGEENTLHPLRTRINARIARSSAAGGRAAQARGAGSAARTARIGTGAHGRIARLQRV